MEQPEAFNASVLTFIENTEFYNILNSRGVDAAVQYFNVMQESEPVTVIFDELEMNSLGYSYLQNEKTKDAIMLFKLNTITYPNSFNVYDSLGEAYLKDGQIDLAIINYERSLELDPNNENARKVLNEIKWKK